MKNSFTILAAVGTLIFAAQANAATVFFDNFDGELIGEPSEAANYELNYGHPPNQMFEKWTVTAGWVDIIGDGSRFPYAQPYVNGLYVDLDGSEYNQGTLTSIALFLAAGDYTLSFDLAGNNYAAYKGPDYVTVDVLNNLTNVSLFNDTYTRAWDQGFLTFNNATFTLTAPTVVNLVFRSSSPTSDNVGLLLDNVMLTDSNPEPTPENTSSVPDHGNTAILLGLATLGMGFVSAVARRAGWLGQPVWN
jgi:hypothetical protein